MDAYRLPNGNLLVPKRAEGEGALCDGMVEAAPGSAEYEEWAAYYRRLGEAVPPAPGGRNDRGAPP